MAISYVGAGGVATGQTQIALATASLASSQTFSIEIVAGVNATGTYYATTVEFAVNVFAGTVPVNTVVVALFTLVPAVTTLLKSFST